MRKLREIPVLTLSLPLCLMALRYDVVTLVFQICQALTHVVLVLRLTLAHGDLALLLTLYFSFLPHRALTQVLLDYLPRLVHLQSLFDGLADALRPRWKPHSRGSKVMQLFFSLTI